MTNDTGFVLWLTGLSGAGKSTIARGIAPRLLERGHRLEVLDGDEVRTNLCQELGFSREDRDTNIARIGYVAGRLAKHGVAVVVAAISPYREARDKVRTAVPNFVEVHVAAPVEVCAERDVKGLYAKALAGEIKNFTGVSDPYEPPVAPEIVLHTEAETVGESVEQVLAWLEANQLTILADTWSPNRDGAALGGNVDHGHPSLISDPWNQSSRASRSLGRPIESNAQPDGLTGGWR